MSVLELILLGLFVTLIWYWLEGIRAKEIAVSAGKTKCRSLGLHFLDDSVALTKLRLRRTGQGHIAVYREFCFEFTSDSERRHRGQLRLLGRQVLELTMEPYRAMAAEQNWIH